jgi:V8-like Glu-specific endopeptidase
VKRILVMTMALVVAGATVPMQASAARRASPDAGLERFSDAAAQATQAYWTTARMATATPETGSTRAVPQQAAAQKSGRKFAGIPTVGVLFYTTGKDVNHYCTASVVFSPKHNLAVTAGHCINNSGRYRSHLAFVPRYDQGRTPFGIWPAKLLLVPPGWAARSDPDLDFGFVVLRSNASRRNVADYTGSNRLTPNAGAPHDVRVVGYPTKANAHADRPIYCDTYAFRRFTYQLQFDCGGYPGGTSGSPWLWEYNSKKKQGKVIGVIGGYEEGGDSPAVSYSAVFDHDIAGLYKKAVADG